jgi:diaminohydroxyphosphoribosylaminopyrimidine deaminase/5-amino-6-(5-phosphoribosylamino)uracil reductase
VLKALFLEKASQLDDMETKEREGKDKEVFMKYALLLAKVNAGKTAPNPWVGAVLVKEGRIIGKGFHKGAGFPHAEIEAVDDAIKRGFSPAGAELFVSLQPCNSYGRTPPCTLQIENYGIEKVYFSLHDPNLDQSNYRVNNFEGGMLEDEGEKILLPYIVSVKEKRPYVIVKLALTLDGKIADLEGNSKYLTSQKSLQLVHILRARTNFILVGKNTVKKDNPYLDTRNLPSQYVRKIRKIKMQVCGEYPNPVKIVLGFPSYADSLNILKGNNVVFFVEEKDKNLIISEFFKSEFIKSKENVSFLFQKEKSVKEVLDFVFQMGGMVLLVEGGIKVVWEFLKDGVVDELWLFFAPKIFGGGKGFDFPDAFRLGNHLNPKIIQVKKISDDVLIRCSLRKDGKFWDLF